MNLKETDVSLLERSCAIYMLLLISDNEGQTKKRLTTSGESYNERTKFQRVNELIAAGLVEYRKEGARYNAGSLYLTEEGNEVVKNLRKVRSVLLKLDRNKAAVESE